MKKVLVLLFAVMATMTVNAQFYVGGSVGFSSVKPDGGESTTMYKIMPEIGYNLSDNWAVGATLGYAKTMGMDMDGEATAMKGFEIAPYVRYTFLKSDLLNLFVDGQVSFNSSKADVDGAESVTTFGVGIKPGLAVNLSKNVSLIAKYGLLGYENQKDSYSKFGLNVDASKLEFGFIYNF